MSSEQYVADVTEVEGLQNAESKQIAKFAITKGGCVIVLFD